MSPLQITSIARVQPTRTLALAQRLYSSSAAQKAGSQNSTPGWGGRPAEDHAVNRSPNDTQADAAKQGMENKGKDGSGATSEKDERNSNQRAKDENPEAPGPVIGMNSERGGKGH